MIEENQALVADQDVTATPAPEAGFSSPEPKSQERDYEAEAREMGWVPESEFKGDKAKWKPATQFVEDGERILPIVRSQLKREREERERERAENAERIARLERMSKTTIDRLRAQHKAELDRIAAEKLQAVQDGDVTRYQALEREQAELGKAEIEDAAPDPKVEAAGKIEQFKAQNDWYETDDVMTAYANHVSGKFAAENPQITLEENLRKTVAAVKSKFPDKFAPKPATAQVSAVDGGGAFSAAPQRQGMAAKLNATERSVAENAVKEGLYKTVEDWAKVYFKQ